MNSFTFFEDYYELITLLNEKDQGELLLAIMKYMFEDIEPELNKNQTKIFNNLKRPLSVSKNKSKNALKTNQTEIKQKSNENQKQNQNKNEKGSCATKSMSMSNKSMSNIFIKPSLEEVNKYCEERKNSINAQSFIDFYESKGWMIGKNKMKDWKAAIRTWEKNTTMLQERDVPKWFNRKDEKEKEIDDETRKLIAEIEGT